MLNEPQSFGKFDPVIFGLRFNIDGALSASNARDLLPLVWRGIHFPPTQEHRDFVRSLSDEDERFNAVAYFSLRVHEARHFHDLLATPYGCVLLRQYFRAAILGQAIMPELLFKMKSMYVPIVEWADNDRYLQRQFPLLGSPPRSIAWFADILSTMTSKLDTFNRGVLASADGLPRIDASGILEASAITSQELHIAETYGAEAALLFRRKVWESSVGEQYYSVHWLLRRLSGEAVPAPNFLALCLCALCGNFQDPDAKHARYPADLLWEMLIWMADVGFRPSNADSAEDVVDMADRFFRKAHGNSLVGNLNIASEANFKTFEALERDAAKLDHPGSVKAAQELVAGFKNYATAYEGYLRKVFANLDRYCGVAYSGDLNWHTDPVFFIESEYGIPLTEELEQVYFVGGAAELRGEADLQSVLPPSRLAHSEDGSFKTAFLLSPKQELHAHLADPAAIDVGLWQRNFEHSEMIRFLIAGGTSNMPATQQENALGVLASIGTNVFNISGEMRTTARVDLGHGVDEMVATIRRSKGGLS